MHPLVSKFYICAILSCNYFRSHCTVRGMLIAGLASLMIASTTLSQDCPSYKWVWELCGDHLKAARKFDRQLKGVSCAGWCLGRASWASCSHSSERSSALHPPSRTALLDCPPRLPWNPQSIPSFPQTCFASFHQEFPLFGLGFLVSSWSMACVW